MAETLFIFAAVCTAVMTVLYMICYLANCNKPISEEDFIMGITDLAADFDAVIDIDTEEDADVTFIVINVKEKIVEIKTK